MPKKAAGGVARTCDGSCAGFLMELPENQRNLSSMLHRAGLHAAQMFIAISWDSPIKEWLGMPSVYCPITWHNRKRC